MNGNKNQHLSGENHKIFIDLVVKQPAFTGMSNKKATFAFIGQFACCNVYMFVCLVVLLWNFKSTHAKAMYQNQNMLQVVKYLL